MVVKHMDQSAARKKISCLHFKLTLRTSDTVHVPVRLIGSNIFSLKKRKQDKPLQFIKEVELLRQTENRKDLSTSTSTIEDPQDKMMRQAQGKNPTTRQSTKSVSKYTIKSMSLWNFKCNVCNVSLV